MKKITLFLLVFSVGLIFVKCSPNSVDSAEPLSEILTISVLIPPFDQAVSFVSKGGYIVSFRLVCVNVAADTVINKLFSEGFILGGSINVIRNRIGKKMQDEIDAYQERHTVFTSAAYNNSPALIQAGLDGGI